MAKTTERQIQREPKVGFSEERKKKGEKKRGTEKAKIS